MKKHFIYQDGKSHKFWDIESNGNAFTVTYGKVDTAGQQQTKTFASEEECQKAAEKLIAEKTKKGYLENGDNSQYQELLTQIKNDLYTDFPQEVEKSSHEGMHRDISNFFRSGPFRKSYLVDVESGDYEWDEDLTEDVEMEMSSRIEAVYKNILQEAEKIFGASSRLPEDGTLMSEDNEDESKEGQVFDEIEWSPIFEKGAHINEYLDNIVCWRINNRYLVLGNAEWQGDGNFEFLVYFSITPTLSNSTEITELKRKEVECSITTAKTGEYIFTQGAYKEFKQPESITRLDVQLVDDKNIQDLINQAIHVEDLKLDIWHFNVSLPNLQQLHYLREVYLSGRPGFQSREDLPEHERSSIEVIPLLVKQCLPTVTQLTIKRFNKVPLPYLFELAKWKKLEVLNLEHNDIQYTQEELNTFIDMLKKSTIKEIYLGGNPQIDNSGVIWYDADGTEIDRCKWNVLFEEKLPNIKISTI
jgi:predicted DNA-binding WGR domain protein